MRLLAVLFSLSSFVFIVPFVELLFGNGHAVEPHQFALNQKDMTEWLSLAKSVMDL